MSFLFHRGSALAPFLVDRSHRPSGFARRVAVGIAVFLALYFTACQSVRMPIPDDLSGGERWAVQGRHGWLVRQSIRFGPYEARDVARSWTRGEDRGTTNGISERHGDQSYSFTLFQDGVEMWRVKCTTRIERGTVTTPIIDVDYRDHSHLHCALSETAGAETWLLTLDERNDRPLEGMLENGPASFKVAGTWKRQHSIPTLETSGYYFTSGGRPVAAVEIVNRGAVTLLPSLNASTTSVLSAAAATLLLFGELRDGTKV